MSVAELSPKPARRATAESMAQKQREISVSEFFTKNRHLLGFDNPAKALLTTVKEAVDNSLDACEEAGILPTIHVQIDEISENRFRVTVEDNGPGIVKEQIPKIFAKLLYGSKFHRLKQARGQQGIGISAAGLYAMLTTGRPIAILSKTGKGRVARKVELRIDTRKNQPDVLKEEQVEWDKDHGTRVELELTGTYRGGRTGVDAYLEQSVVANPHLELTYRSPKGEVQEYPRASQELPREAQEIKPHPHGVELGMLLKMLQDSDGMSVKAALVDNFSRVSAALAQSVCEAAGVKPNKRAPDVHGEEVERLHKALGEVKVMAPPATCVVPIGEELIVAGLKRRFVGGQYFSTTRPPAVYRGNPFVVECGIAYGGDLPLDDQAEVLRFANRVPLQYQPKACAISEAVYELNWRNYGLAQPRGSLPLGPLAIFVHLASVWVPFTSEAKEAVAHYPELLREITLALQDCGRRLAQSLRARARLESEAKRRSLFERYIPELGMSIGKITGRPRDDVEKLFLKALPNFVNMNEPVPEGPPPEGGAAGGAAAPDAPSSGEPTDGAGERPQQKGKKGSPRDKPKGAAAKGKRSAEKGADQKNATSKGAASPTAKSAAAKSHAAPSERSARAAVKTKAGKAATGRGASRKAAQRGGDKPVSGKKGEQLKLID
jgi:DNA topoisomerase VI subunit B